jgi:predicted DNA binding CopG/RHH family protein
MKKEYDFSKGEKNPYAKMFKKQITIRMDENIVTYFKGLSKQIGIPYQNLINMYLRDCVEEGRKPKLKWAS